jgi:hypothetical protein
MSCGFLHIAAVSVAQARTALRGLSGSSHQLERGRQPQAALAGECDAFELAAIGGAGTGEADPDLIAAEDAAVHQQHDAGKSGLDSAQRFSELAMGQQRTRQTRLSEHPLHDAITIDEDMH